MPRQLYPYGAHHCRNLAGRTCADSVTRSELNRASIGGRLDDFAFVRGWRYWRVKGLMPYAMACYIHRRRDGEVRTAGFAGGVPSSRLL